MPRDTPSDGWLDCPSDDCDRSFSSRKALDAHLRMSSRHRWCFLCSKDFLARDDLPSHLERRHGLCFDCNAVTGSYDQLQQHKVRQHGYCSECDRNMGSYEALRRHWTSDRTQRHFSCTEEGCDERFQTPGNLHAHLRSAKHHDEQLVCPFDCDEDRTFISYAAIASHIQAGGCEITRHKFNELVWDCDTKCTITDNTVEPSGGVPTSTIHSILSAAKRSGNYVCSYDICDENMFQSYAGLNAHLLSPYHDADLYKCPGCPVRFQGIDGVYKHINTWACDANQVVIERKIKGIIDRVKHRYNDN
ncbi:hypothetical protein D9611_005157 [Ephemerocybe angulata]|uniref:C2H2-type domain-containing protein n=1 Tax=Ephemerocybe angulata TaxID=980116 RepID=A0A8H5C174_9AGAR|nr:hypothetical protein D9611_005157 [Tulosesus angulatus]